MNAIHHPTRPHLIRYPSRIVCNGREGNTEFVDWYENDEAALADSFLAMQEQGYVVDSVTIDPVTKATRVVCHTKGWVQS